MAHPEQREFFERLKKQWPHHFSLVTVIDFGSLDLNGSLRDLFEDSRYVGVDIRPGKNVDVVSQAHEYTSYPVDTVVSGEMLEHDEHWMESLLNMYRLLKVGGLMAVTAAGWARWEHGTANTDGEMGTSPNYYKGIVMADLHDFIRRLPKPFQDYRIEEGRQGQDIYFYGIKC